MSFWETYRTVWARRWWVLGVVLATGTTIVLGTYLQSRRAESVSEAILTVGEGALGPNGEPIEEPNRRVSRVYQSLKGSSAVVQRAAEWMALDEDRRVDAVRAVLERSGTMTTETSTEAEREAVARGLASARDRSGPFAAQGVPGDVSELAAELRSRVAPEPVESLASTDGNRQFDPLIRVRATFPRSAEASLAANLVCVAFLDEFDRSSRASVSARIRTLTRQRDTYRKDWEEANRRLTAFRRRGEAQSRAGTDASLGGRITQYELERDRLVRDFASFSQRATSFKRALEGAPRLLTEKLPSSENPSVARAQERYDTALARREVLRRGNLGPAADEVVAAEAELSAASEALDAARQREFTQSRVNTEVPELAAQLTEAEVARDAAAQSLRTIEQQLADLSGKAQQMPSALAELSDLEREIKVREARLAQAEQQLSAAQAEVGLRVSGPSVLAPAQPVAADAPAPERLLLYGVALALVVAIGFVLAFDSVDNALRKPADLQRELGLSAAATIPVLAGDSRRVARIAFLDPLSAGAEAFRLLRTDIQFSALESAFRSVLVAGAVPEQGATTVASNLAITLAQTGRRVVLVDADLRRPRLHALFGIPNGQGLTGILARDCPLDEALQATEVENLWLLPSGPLPLMPAELLSSPEFVKTVEMLERLVDFVVIDAPAAVAFSDASAIAVAADATLLVVRAGAIPRGAEKTVLERFGRARTRILGAVLNAAAPAQTDAAYFHGRYYGDLPADAPPPQIPPSGSVSNSADAAPAHDAAAGIQERLRRLDLKM